MKELNELFDTKDRRDLAIAQFKNLKLDAGWGLLKTIVDANIRVLEVQILDGVDGDTKETIDRKRDKLRAYKEVIGTPDYWIENLQTPERYKDDNDPYHTKEDLLDRTSNK